MHVTNPDQIAAKLLTYLREECSALTLDYAEPLTQLQGGQETDTFRFALRGGQDQLPGALVLRLYPAHFGAHNAVWESTVQRVLASTGYPVPNVYLTCTDLSILGGAFFIMALLPGQPLMSAPSATIPQRLGETHAALHAVDPAPLIKAFSEQGIPAAAYRLDRRLTQLRERVTRFPWLQPAVDWLFAQRPDEPAELVICHGDFHPLNILVDGDRVTGVIDWPGFLLADPALDVATTLVLTTIPAKQLAGQMAGLADVDWDQVGQRYLEAYQAVRPLDTEKLAYYRVHRCVHALLEGAEGQMVWRQPPVVNELVAYIQGVTGVNIKVPSKQGDK